MLADSGGSNSCRHYIFKEDLQKLVDEIGVEVRIAHFSPYTSKWNPVEHRVFPHITRSLKGVILRSLMGEKIITRLNFVMNSERIPFFREVAVR